ncbi:uncharacterized protein N7506_001891 [Penicillium brevicompactum]|uniref:uncharacterized protein n=1 Tax=Penicillium brevicompactum TaxID=5074 RepID=UPI002540E46D|nr:uncharacterized protein N7506_001891 [Penicillium brevicompactum]KAJ5348638.1 hypothetical protein N7506_001891 [Penicillium brevicompactum]
MPTGTQRIRISNLLNPASDNFVSSAARLPLNPESQSQDVPGSTGKYESSSNCTKEVEKHTRASFALEIPKQQFKPIHTILRPYLSAQSFCASLKATQEKSGDDIREDGDSELNICSEKNEARAMRLAELVNDYRTLHIYILEHTTNLPFELTGQESYRVLMECRAFSQALLTGNYSPEPIPTWGGDEDALVANMLKQVILDASARRFQAFKIYLRVSAARYSIMQGGNVIRRSPLEACAGRLRDIDTTLQNILRNDQELATMTDNFVASNLHEADLRAGYWVDEDPCLAAISVRIQSQV